MKLFLPLKTLEEWMSADKVDLSDGKVVVKETKSASASQGAVHFVKLVSGDDSASLIGKVKTEAQVQALGAEHMADSVILGEAAYEVATGYLVEVPNPAPQAKPDPKKKGASPEADLLAAFILDKL